MSKKNLNIAYVVRGWPLADFPSGIITYVNNLINGFEQNIHTSIIAHHAINAVDDDRVIVLSKLPYERPLLTKISDAISYRLEHRFFQELRYQSIYSQIAKRITLGLGKLAESPDIIEIEESFGIARWLVKETKIPVVVRLHGPWFIAGTTINLEQNIEYRCRVESEGLAIKNARGLTSPSLYALNRVREFYNLELPEAKVIPNPVPVVPENLRWQGLAEKSNSILFVGRFDLTKGGDLMLDAFRIIASKNRDVQLTFVGPDWSVVKNNRKFSFNDYVAAFIPETHIRKRIHFLGHCNAETISALRKSSLITVAPSRHETFCISLLEALAAGCPSVATRPAAIATVSDGENGLIAETESGESIAEKVLALLDDTALMRHLSQNAISDYLKKYTPELLAKQTANYYQKILNLN